MAGSESYAMSSILEGVGGWKSKPEGSERVLVGVGGLSPGSESLSLGSVRLRTLEVPLPLRVLLPRGVE